MKSDGLGVVRRQRNHPDARLPLSPETARLWWHREQFRHLQDRAHECARQSRGSLCMKWTGICRDCKSEGICGAQESAGNRQIRRTLQKSLETWGPQGRSYRLSAFHVFFNAFRPLQRGCLYHGSIVKPGRYFGTEIFFIY